VLDGEICVFDDQLISQSISWGRADPSVTTTAPVDMAFCLSERGRDLRSLPPEERRAVLEDEITGCDLIHPVRRLPDHGLGNQRGDSLPVQASKWRRVWKTASARR
jgi:ATP-dependent DNA ligase